MKAAYIDHLGSAQHIRYGDFPTPAIGKRDVLVKALEVMAHRGRIIVMAGIAQKLPLSQAAEAHQIYESKNLFGKLVLSPE